MASYIDNFFAGYPDFPYEPTNSAMAEFYRLCNFFGWEKEDNDRKVARNLHMDAMTLQFNHMYGTNVEDMACWWRLCEDLEITPIPKGLDACRNAVLATCVNLVDLVDSPRTGRKARVFGSVQELSEYTKTTGKFFPRENAYAGGVLKFLLRQIINPAVVHRSRGRGRRRA